MGEAGQSLPGNQMEVLHREYVASFPEKMDELEQCVAQLFRNPSEFDESLQQLRLAVHRLAGSSGSFGFSQLHQTARKVESVVVNYMTTSDLNEKSRVELRDLVYHLIGVLATLHQHATSQSGVMANLFAGDVKDSHQDLAVFIISARQVESRLLADMLEGRGFTVVCFQELESAVAILKKADPAVILLDVNCEDDLKRAEKLKVPVDASRRVPGFVLLSEKENHALRVKAAEFGADAFFVTPVNPHNLSSALDVMLDTYEDQRCRLLVIQKENQLDEKLEQIFFEQNMDCLLITEYQNILGAMGTYKPDILLFITDEDKEAMQIARVIRMHEGLFNIPVLFILSEENDANHLAAIQAGADDCIVIDSNLDEYMKTLRNRIFRFRRANNLIILDSLTGMLNREAFLDRASEEISLAARRNETICLAMIDVDRFKQVNDANGHLVGDFVLRHISDYLGRRLRRSDIVGRYAGDEFLVFLPDTDLDSAYLVLDIIRKNLVAQTISVNDTNITISISLGLVAVRPDGATHVEQLIVEADKRLYEAKIAGRNTLIAGIV